MQMSLLRIKDGQPVSVGDIKANVEPVESQVRLKRLYAALHDVFCCLKIYGMPASPCLEIIVSIASVSQPAFYQTKLVKRARSF